MNWCRFSECRRSREATSEAGVRWSKRYRVFGRANIGTSRRPVCMRPSLAHPLVQPMELITQKCRLSSNFNQSNLRLSLTTRAAVLSRPTRWSLSVIIFDSKTQYTPPTPTRRNCRVDSRRRCVLSIISSSSSSSSSFF